MAEGYWQVSLEKHSVLFQHYSSLLFRARILIVGVILVVVGLLCGMGSAPGMANASIRADAEPILAYAASLVVALLYSMETAYIRRLAEVASSAREVEGLARAFPFFQNYQALWHWPLLALYCLAVTFFLAVFWLKGVQALALPWRYGGFLLVAIPPILLARTSYSHGRRLREMDRFRLAFPEAENSEGTRGERTPHNPSAAPDVNRASRVRRR
jgi:hypothetical protein